jgi:hypothetical protein
MDSREQTASKGKKKGYTRPKLVHLGSIRELTFGTSIQPKPDGVFTKARDK